MDEKSRKMLSATTGSDLRKQIYDLLSRKVGILTPFRDGMQTPLEEEKLAGHPIYYAQHATATCCKKCAYYWWGFDRAKAYTEGQLNFLSELCIRYFQSRGFLPWDE